ncbi:hypothetical protein ACFX13_005197 [Malus domestica]
MGYRGFCQWCGTQGHSAKRCPQLCSAPPTVNHTTIRPSTSSPWLLDSSASHHVTSDSKNIPDSTTYDGPDQIVIGNRTGLSITHVGSTSLSSSSTTPFHLNDVMCVPSISRNIISIAKFNRQNATSIEFFPDSFLVKDLNTGAALLRGPNKNDTYEWSWLMPQKQVMSSVMDSSNVWYRRLGHPNHRTYLQIQRTSSIPMSLTPSVCTSCHCNKSHKLPFGHSTLVSKRPLELIYSDV